MGIDGWMKNNDPLDFVEKVRDGLLVDTLTKLEKEINGPYEWNRSFKSF